MWYSVDDYDYKFEYNQEKHLSVLNEYDQHTLAKYCAEDYHSNHDGWEASWPLNIFLYLSETDSKPVAIFEVEREARPVFYTRKIHQ